MAGAKTNTPALTALRSNGRSAPPGIRERFGVYLSRDEMVRLFDTRPTKGARLARKVDELTRRTRFASARHGAARQP
jgi:hypothetical protein